MKQVFLHIGTPKTGTTSIQTFLETNRQHLKTLGYLYPKKTNHHSLVDCLLDQPRIINYSRNPWDKLDKEVNRKDLDKIIISSEFFALQNDSIVARVAEKLKNYDTKVIVYLKRQDKKVESSIGQTIKVGNFTGSVETYLAKKGWAKATYWSMLESWSKYFGQENVVVRPLEKQQTPNLYEDLMKNMNLNSLSGFAITKDCNIKPNLAQLNALRFLAYLINKELGLDNDNFNKLLTHPNILFRGNYTLPFLEYSQHWQGTTNYNLVPYEVKLKILEECAEQNVQIAKQYLNREDGQLFYEPLKPYEHEVLNFGDLTKEQLIDISSFLLLKQRNRLKGEASSSTDADYKLTEE